jgi:hypothetical protein
MVTKRGSSSSGKPEKKSSAAGIEDPEVGDDSTAEGEEEEMEQVDEPGEEVGEAGGEETASGGFPQDVSAQLLDLRESIVSAIKQQMMNDQAQDQVISEDLSGMANIQGVGFSEASGNSGGMPGELALTLYVAEPMAADEAKSVVFESSGISAEDMDSVPVNVVVTGIIDAQVHRMRLRPAPAGISVAHYRVTAGTLGCFARGRTAPRSNRVLMLSNNHVLANSNNANLNDNILQPGPYDGGVNPGDRVAILEKFIPINFSGGVNYVDCATGWCWSGLVKYPDLMYLSGGRPVYFRISSTPVPCQRNMVVGKTGRTTQLRRGIVIDCSATIRVNYGGGKLALFSDQIAIRGIGADFSAGGDSGSLIWTWDARRNPVGLLYAGGGGVTFANKIARVLTALDIVIRA